MRDHCPNDLELTAFLRGAAAEERVAELVDHVSCCPSCPATLARLEPAQPAVQGVTACASAEVDRLIAVGKELTRSKSGARAGVTLSSSGDETGEWTTLAASLGPAQRADELGRLGPYRVQELLGGGMGAVFRGEDPALGRSVALKIMLPRLAQQPGMKARFLREARTAAAIEHDNVVPIFQVGEDRNILFIAMPFLKGMSLEDWCRQHQAEPPDWPFVLRIGREIADGLAAAHAVGLVHRDIKPANVWLDATAQNRALILDFGLAHLARAGTDPQLTTPGTVIGTPAYMAPEQARGEAVDGRADLFSLGVVLYRLCSGELPFKGRDAFTTLMALASHEPLAPHVIAPAVPRRVSAFVMRLLAKAPARRIGSAAAVSEELQQMAGADLCPLPISRWRRRGAWGLAAGAIILGLLGVSQLPWQPAVHEAKPVVDETRATAEWLLGQGATLTLSLPHEDLQRVSEAAQIPTGPWEITSIDWPRTSDEGIHELVARSRQLSSLSIIYCGQGNKPVTGAGIRDLAQLRTLQSVSVSGRFTAEELTPLASLPQLLSLTVAHVPGIGDEVCQVASKFPHLKELMFNACDVTEAGLEPLSGMPALESLYVNSRFLTDDAYARIARIPKLARLQTIGAPQITGAGLTHLQGLPLTDLCLNTTSLADEHLPLLDGLPLRTLKVRQTKITAAGLSYLRVKHPTCDIEADFDQPKESR